MATDVPDERFTGENANMVIGGVSYAISNVSWDSEVNTTDVQHNDSLKPTHAVTGLRYSGSFEYDGKNEDLRKLFFKDDGRPERFTISVREEAGESGNTQLSSDPGVDRTITFENVIVTTVSHDIPSDDVASVSVDFVAENKVVS